jgi:hypothetical protein
MKDSGTTRDKRSLLVGVGSRRLVQVRTTRA